jgi:type IV secretory pathway TraG/TraD family ATPase VirD4
VIAFARAATMLAAAPRRLIVTLAAGCALWALATTRAHRGGDAYCRGARIVKGRTARRRLIGWCRTAAGRRVTLAAVPIGPFEETKHFKLIGTTGTGKSTAIAEMLGALLARGDRAVIADPDEGYLARFHMASRGDVILNPFDRRAPRWDPMAELMGPADPEQLAASLIAAGDDAAGREWRLYARTFLASVLRRVRQSGGDVAELWRLVSVASGAELRPLLQDTPAQSFLDPENARMFGSIRSVAAACTAALEHVRAQSACGFSVRQWVRTGGGVLFLPYRAGQIAALRTLIASWMRLAVFEAMDGSAGDQRLWFIVDELDALGAIDGLRDALARLRKFGGRCVLGMQSIAQVSAIYGAGDAQTIIENCGNTLILRCSASERGGTAQFCSRLIGEREVLRRTVSRGRDNPGGFGGGSRSARRSEHLSAQRVTELAVLPSEIEQLPDFAGYLKTAGSAYWLKVRVRRAQSRRR